MTLRELTQSEQDMVPFKDELIQTPRLFVSTGDNSYFDLALEYANRYSHNPTHKVASVIVKGDDVIGIGTNSSSYHKENGCERLDENGKSLYKSGEGYALCDGCAPNTAHSESLAIKNAFIFGLLNASTQNDAVQKKYGALLAQVTRGLIGTNFVHEIGDYDSFLENMNDMMGEEYQDVHVDVAQSLQGSTFYIYGHFWACQTCWGNSKAAGIETLVVQEQAFKAHSGR